MKPPIFGILRLVDKSRKMAHNLHSTDYIWCQEEEAPRRTSRQICGDETCFPRRSCELRHVRSEEEADGQEHQLKTKETANRSAGKQMWRNVKSGLTHEKSNSRSNLRDSEITRYSQETMPTCITMPTCVTQHEGVSELDWRSPSSYSLFDEHR